MAIPLYQIVVLGLNKKALKPGADPRFEYRGAKKALRVKKILIYREPIINQNFLYSLCPLL
jgi:hypothetical protein